MPVSRSPVPPVAMPALPVRFTNERPSGPAMTVRCPFSTTWTRCAGGELARVLEAIGLHLLDADVEQPRHLPRMRRDDHVDAVAARQPLGIAAERVQRIGVEHQRHARPLDDRVDERGGRRILAEAGPERDDVGLQIEHAIHARLKSIVPAAVSSSASVMYSGAIAATSARTIAASRS